MYDTDLNIKILHGRIKPLSYSYKNIMKGRVNFVTPKLRKSCYGRR